jgi:probable HAF family extracellular repeat protein
MKLQSTYKSKMFAIIIAMALFATLANPVWLGAQEHKANQPHYIVKDLGPLGRPNSFFFTQPIVQSVNNASVNRHGQVAGWSFINSTPNSGTGLPIRLAFLWEKGTMRDLGSLGGTISVVGSLVGGAGGSINNRGQVVGTSNLAGDLIHHPFLWEKGALTDLGTFGGNNGEAFWINDAGEVVGRADVPGSQAHHAFLWRHGVMKDLGTLDGQSCSTALDINARGQIIIDTGVCGVGGGPGALWENGTLYDLNSLISPNSGVTVGDVAFINDRGEIACTGVLPNGDQHELLLVPVDKDDDNASSGKPVRRHNLSD